MFIKLKKHLVMLYGITSSVILTLILTGLFIINFRQEQNQTFVLFQKNVEQITEKIRTDNVINYTWLSKMQSDNHILIFIEDNGKRLSSYKYMDTTPAMKNYITQIKKKALGEGIDLNHKPLFSSVTKTSIYHLNHSQFQTCLGMATLIPTDLGWENIMAVYSDDKGLSSLIKQLIFFIFIDLIGVTALFLMNSLYIGKVLTPLEEGQKKQVSFIAAASHELRSPLTVIKAGLSSIKEDTGNANQFLPHIEGECNRMTRLINDMLLLASADAKSWSIEKEPLDMDTLLIECYDMFSSCYNNKKYQISLNLPEESLHQINGDKERIKQILTILVDNAISYTPSGGEINLRAYNQKHSVYIEVEDHGDGIRDEDKKQVFERFHRGDQSRKDKKHFGLGLSIAKELSELHGGDISIRDTLGGGATFVVKLPW